MENRVEEVVRIPYRAALEGDWKSLRKFYETNREAAYLPLTVTNDNPLHFAVFSGIKSPLKELLEIMPDAFSKTNDWLNTPLHEAGLVGNVEAAEILVACSEMELVARNVIGETPMYRAAAFGKTQFVKYLFEQVVKFNHDMQIQRLRYDNTSILHSAIHGQHFETTLWLLKNDEVLGELQDKDGRTCLQLLAKMPSAFKSGYPMGKLKALLYFCLPVDKVDQDYKAQGPLNQKNDLEYCSGCIEDNLCHSSLYVNFCKGVSRMYSYLWRFLAHGWPKVNTIWNEKRRHESALEVAKMLIQKDKSWKQTYTKPDVGIISFGETTETSQEKNTHKKMEENSIKITGGDNDEATKSVKQSSATPLLIATSTGIIEIVKRIIEVYPQAVEHVSYKGRNIMHVAIRHRQKEIFDQVKTMRIPMTRLTRKVDNDGYTLLHHVSDMKHYGGGTQPNPALQLQEELQWFEEVKTLIPSHYAMHHNKNYETAQEFFEKTHTELLKEAGGWLKRTSESCSVIAVLIATVAFTAAYSVPGGVDDKTGLPVLFHHPFFLVFSIMDVLSLISSLISVVMFISILTSPFRLQDFRYSLPRKLTLGFTFLFVSVATTMLAFSATVLLLAHMGKSWTATLIYGVAFVPVTVFALLQFPLYMGFVGTLKFSFSVVEKILPWNFLRPLFGLCPHSICKQDKDMRD